MNVVEIENKTGVEDGELSSRIWWTLGRELSFI